ncbi:MAG: hypothetical protein HFH90_02435 [Lachnospiraceae bacterium]|jgi:hypothetical protein|nr:hypothetical protein [Lachnospiraceae bacterium]
MVEWEREWAYEGGTSGAAVYNAGPMLENDSEAVTEEDSRMLLVADTCRREYEAYLEKLCGMGFRKVFENHTGAVDCCQLMKGEDLLYVYYTLRTGEVRVIADKASVPLDEFSDSYMEEGPAAHMWGTMDSAEIYQYGLYYDPCNGHSPTTTNCGMFYIIRLRDNRLVMIDGGHILQCSAEAVEGMYRFLRRITGTAEGERLGVAAWIFTHAHDDHMAACVRLLRTYPEAFEIERAMFNFPSHRVCSGHSDFFCLRATLREYCPNIKCLKLHSGQRIVLANVCFDVLYTHEDAVRLETPEVFPFHDFNCTSVILKMTTGMGTIVWLGDTSTETEELVVRTVPAAVWKADVVQVAHHAFNFLTELYALIDADYAMVPNSRYGGNAGDNHQKLMDVVRRLPSPDNLWYEDETTGFRFEEGSFRVILKEDLVGGEHDGTALMG